MLTLTSLADGVTEPMDEEAAMQWVRSMRVHLQRNLVDPKPIDVRPPLRTRDPRRH